MRRSRGARDDAKAALLFETACAGGQPMACYFLGVLHETGRGVPVNKARAAELISGACKAGFTQACEAR